MTTDSNRVQEHRESLLDLANRSSTPLRVITEAHGNSMLPQDSRSIRAHPYLDLPSPPPRVNELLERAEMLHSRLPIRRQWKARRETMYQMYRSMSVEYFDSIMSSRLPDYREAPRCVAPPQPLPTAPLEQTTPPIVTPTLHLPVLEVIAAEQRAHALADPTNVVAANVARMTRPQLEHFRIRTSSQSPGKTASPELATAQQQQQLAVGSRKRPAEPAELDESSRKRVGDITQIPRPGSGGVKTLCFSVLRDLESAVEPKPKRDAGRRKNATGTRKKARSSSKKVLQPALGLTTERPTDFLLQIKERVAQLTNNGKRQLGAIELAELRFERGALLSVSSGDTAMEDEDDELHSVKSNKATVAGKISPEKIRSSMRAKLRREGQPEACVKYELACHLSPEDARLQQRQRRCRDDDFAMRRKEQLLMSRRRDAISCDVLSTEANREVSPRSPAARLVESPVSPASAFFSRSAETKQEEQDHSPYFEDRAASEPYDVSEGRHTPGPSDLTRRRSMEFTRDDKIVACRRQKAITLKLADLQKRRDRGELTATAFEAEKSEIFKEIFETDEEGNVTVRRSNWESVRDLEAIENPERFWVPQKKKSKGSQRAPPEEIDLDYMNETDRERGKVSDDEDDETEFAYEEDLTGLEIQRKAEDDFCLDQTVEGLPIPLGEKEYMSEEFERIRAVGAYNRFMAMKNEIRDNKHKLRRQLIKKMRNIERREMLMRRFDQRAPPEERMFKQDTSVNIDGTPTRQQKENWGFWYTPLQLLPDWMKAVKHDRQIIFPEDIKKI